MAFILFLFNIICKFKCLFSLKLISSGDFEKQFSKIEPLLLLILLILHYNILYIWENRYTIPYNTI